MNRIRFGTGGIPITTPRREVEDGVKRIRELGLDAMELEFVYQVFVPSERRESLKRIAIGNNVDLTVHGSYFINLAAIDKAKWHASQDRIVQCAKAGFECGAKSLTFHSAALMGRDEKAVFAIVRDAFAQIYETLNEEKIDIKLSPEITGKAAQFAGVEMLIELAKTFKKEGMGICVDFAHQHARNGGGWNTYEEFKKILTLIQEGLGKEALHNLHMHMSGINYSAKGERNHLTLLPTEQDYLNRGISIGDTGKLYDNLEASKRLDTPDIAWMELMHALKDMDVGGVLICESPNLEQDALLMQSFYNSL